jgi:nucleoside-diphosphate-sugar epimerase
MVTGAAGFLGRHVLAELSAAGHEVTALIHKASLPKHLATRTARVVEGDLTDAGTWRDALSQADGVCHFAAYIPSDYEDHTYAHACLQVNSLATLEMAQTALKARNCRFVYASAGNAYSFNDAPADEETLFYPAARATYYLASKTLGELYVEHLRRAAGLEAICFRISTPYGVGMPDKSAVAYFMKRANEGLPLQVLDGGIPAYDFVYAGDVARLVVAALTGGLPGIYNVGSGTAHSVAELAQAVAETYPERKISIEIKPCSNSTPAGFGALSVKKAAETWGYRPLSLRDGLAEYKKRMDQEPS